MANRLFEFNGPLSNGSKFVDPAKLSHTASLRQIFTKKNSAYGAYQHLRSEYSQNSLVSFSPNPTCTDTCKTITQEGKQMYSASYPETVPFAVKAAEFDAFIMNLIANRDVILSGRQLQYNATLVAEIIA